ncbi:MAG: antitoxin [Spirochaetota bacterium]|nr:antitoxin [Spirochaetota bacterium]
MRTTLTIDDDIIRIARSLAQETNQSVGAVVSRLARKGLKAQGYDVDNLGLPLFEVSENAPVFGPEEVARGEDEI